MRVDQLLQCTLRTGAGVALALNTSLAATPEVERILLPDMHSHPTAEAPPGVHTSSNEGARPIGPTPDWIGDADVSNSKYGESVSTAGDVNGDGYSDVLVTAPGWDGDRGVARVYLGSANGLAESAAWTVQGSQPGVFFGISADAAGDVNGDGYDDVIVGHWGYTGSHSLEGAAFVFHGSSTGLSTTPNWQALGGQVDAQFGWCVASAGDVDADGYDDVIVGTWGARFVRVFFGSASGLSAGPNWSYTGPSSSGFGYSVSSAGDLNGDGFADIVVGAPIYDNGQTNEGGAFVFFGSATGPSASPGWIGESDRAQTLYGTSVSLAGDVDGDGYCDLVIGAPGYDAGNIDEGRVWFYRGSPTVPQFASILGAAAPAGSRFGSAVRAAGDVNADGFSDVILGAEGYNGGAAEEGRAYVHFGLASGLDPNPAMTVESNESFAHTGASVSGAGDVNGDGCSDVVIGTPAGSNGQNDEGYAWVFHGSQGNLNTVPSRLLGTSQADGRFGHWVSAAGDVNGDGYGDVMAGAFVFDNGQTDEGALFLYYGGPTSPDIVSGPVVFDCDQAGAYFAVSADRAGDVNGDGYDDVIVGAPRFDGAGGSDTGAAHVYLGSATGLEPTPHWVVEGVSANAWFGYSVSGAGDVNGDGYADVMVGSPLWSGSATYMGAAYLYLGSPDGLATTPAWSGTGQSESAFFGFTVTGAGDIDGDGYSDMAVAAEGYTGIQTGEGAVFVYFGSPDGPSSTPDWSVSGGQQDAGLSGVSPAGDVNGDGYGDLLLSAESFNGAFNDEGRVWCYYGSASGLVDPVGWVRSGGQMNGYFGSGISTAGDVNRDGYADVIVGHEGYNASAGAEGAAYVYLGGPGGLQTSPAWTYTGSQQFGRFGLSVSEAGDLGADGSADVLVGTEYWDAGGGTQPNAGLMWIFLGNSDTPFGGLGIAPQQASADGETVALLGSSGQSDRFRLRALGRNPMGRGSVRLEWQVAEPQEPIGLALLNSGAWVDTGAPVDGIGSAAAADELVVGLDEETVYQWRLRIRTDSVYLPATKWASLSAAGQGVGLIRTGDAPTTSPEAPALGAGLASVHPNPMHDSTSLALVLDRAADVVLSVHDVAGRRVSTLWRGPLERGRHVYAWDGTDARGRRVASGLYFARFDLEGKAVTSKIWVTR